MDSKERTAPTELGTHHIELAKGERIADPSKYPVSFIYGPAKLDWSVFKDGTTVTRR